jgi:hypothetical protein
VTFPFGPIWKMGVLILSPGVVGAKGGLVQDGAAFPCGGASAPAGFFQSSLDRNETCGRTLALGPSGPGLRGLDWGRSQCSGPRPGSKHLSRETFHPQLWV